MIKIINNHDYFAPTFKKKKRKEKKEVWELVRL